MSEGIVSSLRQYLTKMTHISGANCMLFCVLLLLLLLPLFTLLVTFCGLLLTSGSFSVGMPALLLGMSI